MNEHGNGFEATASLNSLNSRVDLDLCYTADGEIMDDESIGICMTADAALGLADMLSYFAFSLREKEQLDGFE